MDFLKNKSHESYDRKEKMIVGSDRKFGNTFALIFFVMALAPWNISNATRIFFSGLGLVFAWVAWIKPSLLNAINKIWAQFGLILGKIFSPIILGILFFLAFFPIGLLLKIFKKDILNQKINKHASTYWVDSTLMTPTSMKDQF
jgi:hypothetical protein